MQIFICLSVSPDSSETLSRIDSGKIPDWLHSWMIAETCCVLDLVICVQKFKRRHHLMTVLISLWSYLLHDLSQLLQMGNSWFAIEDTCNGTCFLTDCQGNKLLKKILSFIAYKQKTIIFTHIATLITTLSVTSLLQANLVQKFLWYKLECRTCMRDLEATNFKIVHIRAWLSHFIKRN